MAVLGSIAPSWANTYRAGRRALPFVGLGALVLLLALGSLALPTTGTVGHAPGLPARGTATPSQIPSTPPALTHPLTPLTTLNGVDVSHYQQTVNWGSVFGAGYTFAFAKAAEGESSGCNDNTFSTNMVNGKAAGLYMAGYDFAELPTGTVQACSSADNATTEANTFLAVAGPYFKDGYMYPALDQEQGCPADSSGSLTAQQLSHWDGMWLSTVSKYISTNDGYNILPIIYTDSSEAGSCIEPWLTMYPLWIANYGVTSPNTGVWSSWAYWQYSSSGSVPGISGQSDMDYFNGNAATLNTTYVFGGGGTPPGPTVSYAMKDLNTGTALSCGATFSVGDVINFTATVTGGTGPFTYAWSFGDGGSAITNPANHQYTAAGSVNPTLTVTDANGKTGSTGSGCSFTVSGTSLSATATATPTSGAAPLSVAFSGAATGGSGTYSSWFWNFGDGTAHGTTQSPKHTYSSAGTYTATLIVNDSAGHSASASAPAVTVTGSNPPVTVSATGTPTSGSSPLTVTFGCLPSGGSGAYSTYAWSFGDGTTGSTQNPTHVYTVASGSRTFTASVTVTDSTGSSGTSNSVSITVSAGAASLSITSSASAQAGTTPLSVQFTSQPSGGSGSYTSFAWNFGDGGSASTQNASHSYATAGHYNATVKVTDSSGTVATSTPIPVNVWISGGSGSPSVSVSGPASASAGSPVTFTASPSGGSGSYTSYAWSFGDTSTTTTSQSTTSHSYSAAGAYSVTVTVTDSSGKTGTSPAWTITVSAGARDAVVVGQVMNVTSQFTIGGASIKVLLASNSQVQDTMTTGPNGTFRAALPAGTYLVNVSAGGYRSAQQTVTVSSGTYLPVFFNLTAAYTGHGGTGSSTGAGASPWAVLESPLALGLLLAVVIAAVAAAVLVSRRHRRGPGPSEPSAFYDQDTVAPYPLAPAPGPGAPPGSWAPPPGQA